MKILKGRYLSITIEDEDGDIWYPDIDGKFSLKDSETDDRYMRRTLREIYAGWGIVEWKILDEDS